MDSKIENPAPVGAGHGVPRSVSVATQDSHEHKPSHRKKPVRRQRVTARVIEPAGVRVIEPCGRDAQTLEALLSSGRQGITALDLSHWALRLSHYIFKLRRTYGLQIEMVEEGHGGDFPGKHGRYFLRSQVEILPNGGVA